MSAVGEGLAPAACDAQRILWFDLVSDTAADTLCLCVFGGCQERLEEAFPS